MIGQKLDNTASNRSNVAPMKLGLTCKVKGDEKNYKAKLKVFKSRYRSSLYSYAVLNLKL